VRLDGALDADGVRDALAWADVFVHAAISEGFCIAVTEAQAMRLPAVVTDADGLRENVSDAETGFVVPRRDPAVLAERLALLASDPELREQMAGAGRARVERLFTLEVHVGAMEDLFRGAVARRRGGRHDTQQLGRAAVR
jgi:colanic acid/amylovoran biosynthesis glycosyltransferase